MIPMWRTTSSSHLAFWFPWQSSFTLNCSWSDSRPNGRGFLCDVPDEGVKSRLTMNYERFQKFINNPQDAQSDSAARRGASDIPLIKELPTPPAHTTHIRQA